MDSHHKAEDDDGRDDQFRVRRDLHLTAADEQAILNHMVQYQGTHLDAVFSALGDPTRRAILARLMEGEASVSELAEPHEMSLTAVAKHLRVLEGAGLLTRKKEGRVMWCSLEPEPLKGAAEWIGHYQRFWEERLDALADYFDRVKLEEKQK